MERRNTIQKELVRNAVFELRRHVTADDVYDYLTRKYTTISRGTVYRNLKLLSEEGLIKRIKNSEGADIYDFSLHEHYHIKCSSCGIISDVDMDAAVDITSGITDMHGFELTGYDIFFEGICPKCRNRQC